MNIFSNRFEVEFDEQRDAFVIRHPDARRFPTPLVEIRGDTLAGMSLQQASQFIGERLILLVPRLRERFADYLWTDDGQPPKKTS